MPAAHILLALVVVSIWGGNFVIMRLGLAEFPPLLLTALRFVFAAIPLIFFVAKPQGLPAYRAVAIWGGIQFAGQFGLLFSGMYAGFPTGLTSMVVQSQALFSVALAAWVLGERTVRQQWWGIGVALFGMGLAGWGFVKTTGATLGLFPFILVLAAGGCWAAANIQTRLMNGKPETRAHWSTMAAWGSLFAVAPLLMLSYLIEGGAAMISALQTASVWGWAGLVFQGIVVTFCCFGAWAWLIQLHGAGRIAPFTLLVPVAGFSASSWFLNEPLEGWKLGAFAVVIVGLVLNQTAKK